ncbi:hypothetical protein M404DRAFT_907177 [Pisolithus tinctorius Marx 270]|uniref:Uncharacterized protein n=1 Tax=Pisolithus tinctorius Marx 270 TaxID=870435 RepID=A0A0C3PPN5_PISTI|nr:hypothetical protein M404DRAFT_907177 [Pisolithus tinctorius Marx 270]
MPNECPRRSSYDGHTSLVTCLFSSSSWSSSTMSNTIPLYPLSNFTFWYATEISPSAADTLTPGLISTKEAQPEQDPSSRRACRVSKLL